MRLVVKQGDHTVNELQFAEGPVHFGRKGDNQVVLPKGPVSKRHAAIFNDDGKKWVLEDLDSANKTYLNDRAIHRAEIKTGDCIRIADFTIEVDLTDDKAAGETDTAGADAADTQAAEPQSGKSAAGKTAVGKSEAGKSDVQEPAVPKSKYTMAALSHGPQIIIRKPGAEKAPPIRFPAERAVDFLQATEEIGKVGGLEEMLKVLLDITSKQFGTYNVWGALRGRPEGRMTAEAGRKRDGQKLQRDALILDEKIDETIEKEEFLLFIFSRDMDMEKGKQVRSLLIAPVINSTGCFGVLYADNTFRDDHYNLGDLDYFMLLAIHTATVIEKL